MAKLHWTTNDIPLLSGKTAVVTGANSGIGWHTALELARAGCDVILTTRNEEKGRDALARIRQEVPAAIVRTELLDLASLRSVRAFAARIAKEPKLDLLINNAGVMSVPRREMTEDGFERQLGTNYLGPFALTLLLLPVLTRSQSPRVTTVSSGAAYMGMRRIAFEDLQLEHRYEPWRAYCQSKLADLMFAQELGRRCSMAGIALVSNAAHPGYAITNLQTSGRGKPQTPLQRLIALFMAQDAAQGSLPTLRAATEPSALSGSYYAPNGLFEAKGHPILIRIPKPATDEGVARRLWEESLRLTGVEDTTIFDETDRWLAR